MNWIRGLAALLAIAGIGIVVSGSLTHLGYVLLFEVGVLCTLMDEPRELARRLHKR